MLNLDTVSLYTGILSKSKTLVKVRLMFYFSALVHLVAVSYWLLTINFSQFDDPEIQLYQKIRFKLITAWFNLFSLGYFPICLYCEWRELRGDHKRRHVRLLNKLRTFCFSSILLPFTAFGDILFWRIWNTRMELIAPPSIHQVVPYWSQHCMHTVSLVVVLLDLVLVRRERPKNNIPNIIIMSTFLLAYTFVCTHSYLNGVYVYPVLKLFSGFKFILLVVYAFVEILFYYTSQWLFVDVVWGQGNKLCTSRRRFEHKQRLYYGVQALLMLEPLHQTNNAETRPTCHDAGEETKPRHKVRRQTLDRKVLV